MKTMVALQRLMAEVENDTLDPETTLIDADGIAVLDEDYPIHTDQPVSENQEAE